MKVFLGLYEIAGYFKNLKEGFRELGFDCDFINLYSHPFDYGNDDVPCCILKIMKYLANKNSKRIKRNKLKEILFILLQNIFRPFLLFWAIKNYDIFILGFNAKILTFYDYYIIKIMNKKLYYVNFGADSRPPYIDGARTRVDYISKIKRIHRLSKEKSKTLKLVENNSDAVLSYPPMAHLYKKKKINSFVLGFPYKTNTEFENLADTIRTNGDRRIRILHSPSDEYVKGSALIREIIKKLIDKGHPVEYIEIKGMKNSAVLEELQKCDFIIDQIWSDTPMAGFATEAAFFGKPAVVGGYYATMIREEMEEKYIPPSLFVHPDQVEAAVERMIVDLKFRLDLGKRAQEFVRANWSPKAVAEKYVRIINEDVPEDWWFDPNKIRYLQGAGLEESKVKDTVRRLIEYRGRGALQLTDKPELEQAFVDFAYSDFSSGFSLSDNQNK